MKFKILVSLIYAGGALSASSANASGCGSYDYFREIEKVQEQGAPHFSRDQYLILARGEHFIRVRVPSLNNLEITLLLENEGALPPQLPTDLDILRTNDVRFTEGNGCGPVYICATGRFQISVTEKRKLKTYSWPVIKEFLSYDREGWVAGSLLPTFTGLNVEGEKSDIPQCIYGEW